MKKEKIVTIVLALVFIVVLVVTGTVIFKESRSEKIDTDTKQFVSELNQFVQSIDDDQPLSETKSQVSAKTIELQEKYSDGNGVGIETTEILNFLSGSNKKSTRELKLGLGDTMNKSESRLGGLLDKGSVKPQQVSIASSTVCANYGMDSKYCLDGTNKKLNAYVYINDENSTNWVLLLHGNTMNGKTIYNALGQMYADKGYNVIAPDFRGQGKSDGKVALGYLESLDSYDWIRYIHEKYRVKNLVVHGVSLGGATTIQLATNPDFANELRTTYHVRGFVDDCGYSSMTNVINGMFSVGDVSSLTAVLEKANVKLSEFEEKITSMFNGLNINVSGDEIDRIVNGEISIDQFEQEIAAKYGQQYEQSKQIINSISDKVCNGLSYEECIKNAYQFIQSSNNGNIPNFGGNVPNFGGNTPDFGGLNPNFGGNSQNLEEFKNAIGSYFPVQRREAKGSLMDNIIEKVIIDLLDVGLTSDNFEKYQNSFSTGRNFQAGDKVLIVHGQKDTTVKPENSVIVEAKAKEANTKLNHYWKVDGMPHAFVVIGVKKNDYKTLVHEFLDCVSNDLKCSDVGL